LLLLHNVKIAMSDARTLARRIAETMLKGEGTGPSWGIRVEDADVGYSKISMTVRDDMLNSHRIAHGGLVFALADTAFAYACNSRNQVTVAQSASIVFVEPVESGERLEAEAREVAAKGRSGVYSITVRGDGGRIVAQFQGQSRTIGGPIIEE
jgi:acyl-CoA thioesterase